MRKYVLFACISLALSGCATAAQRQFQNIHQTDHGAVVQLKACVSAIMESPEAEPVRSHEPVDLREATLDLLMDSSKATPKQIAAIKAIHPQLNDCRTTALNTIARVTPGIAAILAEEMQKAEVNLIALLKRKLTWGEYITKEKELGLATAPQITAEGQRIDRGLEQSHEAELARRQAASKAITDYLQTQQMINAMKQAGSTQEQMQDQIRQQQGQLDEQDQQINILKNNIP
jgi:hypothetical protein